MKHILFVLPYLKIGGTLTSFTNLISLLDKRKYKIDVFVITKDIDDKVIVPPGVKMVGMPYSTIVRTKLSQNLRNKVRRILRWGRNIFTYIGADPTRLLFRKMAKPLSNKYDVVIAFQEGQATKMAQYIIAPQRIAWIHSIFSRFKKITNEDVRVYGVYDKVVCVSKTACQDMITSEPKWKDKIHVVYNVMNTSKIKVLSENLVSLGGNFNIVSVGRIDPVKRFSKIPHIASQLIEAGLLFDWWIIGGKADNIEYNKLVSEIEKYNVSKYVHLLGKLSNPYPYIKQSDLLICLSSSETFNYSIAEAKVLNTPIVTTDFPSAFEFIQHEVTGLIYPIENVPDGILRILNNKHLYNEIISNLAMEKNRNSLIKEQFEKLLED